jgi:hypothetical protein
MFPWEVEVLALPEMDCQDWFAGSLQLHFEV